MQESILNRKEIAPLPEEQFPQHLSPQRRKREPVLYVPGFFRFYVLSAALRRRLKNLDFEVFYVRIPNFAAGDIRKAARVLLEKMEMMRVLLGVRRLSVIGQGMGGLTARCMVEQLGGKDYLSRLIMLGTPNHGSYAMYPFLPFKAARQMLPASAFLSSLNFAYRGLHPLRTGGHTQIQLQPGGSAEPAGGMVLHPYGPGAFAVGTAGYSGAVGGEDRGRGRDTG